MRKKYILAGCVVVSLLFVLVAAAGGFLYWRLSSAKANEIVPRTLFVTLTKPFDGSRVALGEPIPVAAEAMGDYPIQTLELWANGVLVKRTNAQNPQLKQLTGFWNWTPESEGRLTLTARGLDMHGQAVVSNSVRVLVGPAAPLEVSIMPGEGDTLNSLAAEYNVPPADAAEANPGVDPAATLPGGQLVEMPIPAGGSLPPGIHTAPGGETAPTPPPPPDPPPPPPGPDNDPPGAPAAPKILIHVNPPKGESCTIEVLVVATSEDTQGLRLFWLQPQSTIPSKAAEIYGDTLDWSSGQVYGEYQFFGQAFNVAGVADSEPVNASVTGNECAQYAVKVTDVKLISRDKLDKVYCFVTIDQKTHFRIPPTPDSFIPHMEMDGLDEWAAQLLPYANMMARSGFDLSPYMPVVYPKNGDMSGLKFECWDWNRSFNMGFAEKSLTDDELKKIVIINNDNYDIVGVFGAYPTQGVKQVYISAPYNLRSTGDPNLCAQHYGNSFDTCAQYIKIGMATFVWDYAAANCFPGTEEWCTWIQEKDIEGYRIYRHDGTNRTQWAFGVAGGAKITAGFAQWITPACYTVRAYQGSIESKDSNVVCLYGDPSSGSGIKTISLPPSQLGVRCRFIETGEAFGNAKNTCIYFETGQSYSGEITVGHQYSIGSGGSLDIDTFGHILFEKLDDVKGKPIVSARLKYFATGTQTETDYWIVTHSEACARSIGVTTDDYVWFGVDKTAPNYDLIQHFPKKISYDEVQIDVTDIVKGWSQGQKNSGFVLDGRLYNGGAWNESRICRTTYNNFQLEITYYPNP